MAPQLTVWDIAAQWLCRRKAAAWDSLVEAGRIVPRPENGSM
ncbi:hypothetical protein [Nocardia sp. A7]